MNKTIKSSAGLIISAIGILILPLSGHMSLSESIEAVVGISLIFLGGAII